MEHRLIDTITQDRSVNRLVSHPIDWLYGRSLLVTGRQRSSLEISVQ